MSQQFYAKIVVLQLFKQDVDRVGFRIMRWCSVRKWKSFLADINYRGTKMMNVDQDLEEREKGRKEKRRQIFLNHTRTNKRIIYT